MEDTNRVRDERLKKVEALREAGVNPYANGFTPDVTCLDLVKTTEGVELPGMTDVAADAPRHKLAGRVMFKNVMGKAMFARLRDRSVGVDSDGPQNFQVYLRRDVMDADAYALIKKQLDIGDILAVEGPLFQTRTGEPTIMVETAQLLTKSVRPLPDKFHGLNDVEMRFRQRYVDLIVNPEARHTFHLRSKVMDHMRRFLADRDFIEVETPILHPIPGGATARPFETFHNALQMPLYLRIAPELYLKRLVVGGLERVFEMNRSFRNEGLSPKHNPEFTMLEFYQAYSTYEDLMTLTETLISTLASNLNGDACTTRPYGDHIIDYAAPWRRLTARDSLVEVGGLAPSDIIDRDSLAAALAERGIHAKPSLVFGELIMHAFDVLVEEKLIQPTFITQFPVETSPLARRNEADPAFTDRFEFFIAGAEIGNAFSELNDPIDQRERFEAQAAAREAGDDESMYVDLDYIRALEYGMPPTAGEGIGIDRLVMLMANQHSIREVVFFPHMRPE
ncbi:MAG: lysyl-tRNA synthetase class 2 [Myxococcota bacterium]|jgi:lysyl-tRNA synthetase class 2